MGLSNYQLVLLDNLIYLDTIVSGEGKTIEFIVNKLLYAPGSNEAGSGTIITDCLNAHNGKTNSMMDIDEWKNVLLAIEADRDLCNLQIHSVEDAGENGFRAATFISHKTQENVIIFRGTSTANEWVDNGQGGYSVQTENQYRAVEYVNNLDVVNNYSFITSGHSKGGNLAQYATLFSTDTLIDKCLAFDGQGFSKELCETEAYQKAIEQRGKNLYMLSSSCDCVNVLFNMAVDWSHRIYLEANPVGMNVMGFHKPNNVFAVNGEGEITGLNEARAISAGSYCIFDFIRYITENESDVNNKKTVYDSLMAVMAAIADKNDDMEVVTDSLVKQLLVDLAVKAVVTVFLGSAKPVLGTMTVGEKEFDMDTLGQALTKNEYKGEIYELIDSGTLDLMGDYFVEYAKENKKNLFALVTMAEEYAKEKNVIGNLAMSVVPGGIVWQDIVQVLTSDMSYNKEVFLAELEKLSNCGTNKLGEGTKGVSYVGYREDGGLLYRGNGGYISSIAGTDKEDYLHGGNGIDIIKGGAGDDVLFGGRGDDILYGEGGHDIYAVNRYDGKDTIYNQASETELNFVFFGSGIDWKEVEYTKENGNDLCIRYNKDFPDECQVIVKDFFLSDGSGNLPYAVDAVMFESGRVVTIQEIFRIVQYDGEQGKTLMEKVKAMTQEERDKILAEYDFLKTEYEMKYGNKPENSDNSSPGSSEENNTSGNVNGTNGSASGGSGSTGTASSISGSTDYKDSGNSNCNDNNSAAAGAATANVGNKVKDAEESLLGKDADRFYEATVNRYVDPIVMDLNGDGIFTTSLGDGVHFDFNGDGFAEKTAWVSAGDGLLVRDINHNGVIDDGRELFGDQTLLGDGSTAPSGFEALADLDDNGDGVIDDRDRVFSELKVWMDFDSNGKSDDKELFSLNQMGILSIDLTHNVINKLDVNGNIIKSQGVIGGLSNRFYIHEYGFSIDYVDTEYRGTEIDISVLEEGLPEIKGCGMLLDLSKAMAVNTRLHEMVKQYIEEKSMTKKQSFVQDILFCWAEVEDIEKDSRGRYIDARCLGVLEKVYGQDFIGINGPNPIVGAADILNSIYSELVRDIGNRLLVQTVYKDALAAVKIIYNAERDSFECNFEEAFTVIGKEYPEYYVAYFVDYLLEETAVGDYFDKQSICDQIRNRNFLWEMCISAEKIISGNNEDNCLYGSNTADVLIGDRGNDLLYGESGDDTYIFNLGDGEDTIVERGGTDRILFGAGIKEEDILVSRENLDLCLTNRESGDRIRVKDFFYDACYFVEEVEFADGTKWNLDDIKDKARYYYGTEGNDTISTGNSYYYAPSREDDIVYAGAGDDTVHGNNGDDTLYGEEGNDTLYGDNGNDVLYGGAGNDTLYGGYGNDTYVFHLGDGEDTIVETGGTDRILFGAGIKEEDILVSRENLDLCLTNRESGDRIRVKDFFYDACYFVEEVEFADGTKWNLDEIKDKARYYYGTEGNDTISTGNSYYYAPSREDDIVYAGAGDDTVHGNNGDDTLYGEEGNDTLYGDNGNDVLYGGAGNDTLYGGYGNDTYVFHLGDGEDTIVEGGGTDKIAFGEEIAASDLMFAKEGNNLKISLIGQDDNITISNYFYDDWYKVESFQTSDGSTLDYTKLNVMIQAMASFEDSTGMMWEEAIQNKNEQANDIVNQWWTKE